MTEDDGRSSVRGEAELLEVVQEELLGPLADRAERDQRRELEALIEAGLSPVLALDYYMVEMGDYSATEWAEVRGVSPQAVWESVDRAKEQVSDRDF